MRTCVVTAVFTLDIMNNCTLNPKFDMLNMCCLPFGFHCSHRQAVCFILVFFDTLDAVNQVNGVRGGYADTIPRLKEAASPQRGGNTQCHVMSGLHINTPFL